MKIEQFKATIKEKLEVNPHALDDMDNVISIGGPEQISSLLSGLGEQTLNSKQQECVWRAWAFEARLEDGCFLFVCWDIGNSGLSYMSELKYDDLVKELKISDDDL